MSRNDNVMTVPRSLEAPGETTAEAVIQPLPFRSQENGKRKGRDLAEGSGGDGGGGDEPSKRKRKKTEVCMRCKGNKKKWHDSRPTCSRCTRASQYCEYDSEMRRGAKRKNGSDGAQEVPSRNEQAVSTGSCAASSN
ncbi:hypothetical protein K439DRAFT_1658303 [Ramaria rubella]|nr:hypothetical protein K439DRAFT_1658303 [Ramaria rubella]